MNSFKPLIKIIFLSLLVLEIGACTQKEEPIAEAESPVVVESSDVNTDNPVPLEEVKNDLPPEVAPPEPKVASPVQNAFESKPQSPIKKKSLIKESVKEKSYSTSAPLPPVTQKKVSPQPVVQNQNVIPSEAPPTQSPLSLDSNTQTPSESVDLVPLRFWLGLALGMGYSENSQTFTATSSGFFNANVQYGGFGSPAFHMNAGTFFNPKYGLELQYSQSPGKVNSSSSITVQQGSYARQSFSVDALIHLSDVNAKHVFRLRPGIQIQELPYLIPTAAQIVQVEKLSLTNIAIGGDYIYHVDSKLRYEAMLQYQAPISSRSAIGSSIEIKSKWGLNAMLGQTYRFDSGLTLGAFLKTQMQVHSLSETDSATSRTQQGQQTLLQSDFLLRIGFEY